MDLFSASLHQHCDYCPVALTSVVVNVLERLTVLTHLKSVTNSKMDPLQFAYSRTWCLRTYTHIDTMQTTHIVSPTRTTDARMMMAQHFVMQHLESPNIYAHRYNANYTYCIVYMDNRCTDDDGPALCDAALGVSEHIRT